MLFKNGAYVLTIDLALFFKRFFPLPPLFVLVMAGQRLTRSQLRISCYYSRIFLCPGHPDLYLLCSVNDFCPLFCPRKLIPPRIPYPHQFSTRQICLVSRPASNI